MAAKQTRGKLPHPNPAATLIGDLDAARIRLLRFAELAAKECDAGSLNVLSITIAAHLGWPLGRQTAAMLIDQIDREIKSERLKDWTLRYKEIPWGKA